MAPTLQFQTTAGILLEGARFDAFQPPPRATGIGVVLDWNSIKPISLRETTWAEVAAAMRSGWEWEQFIVDVARALHWYDGDQIVCFTSLSEASLRADWPARILNGQEFLTWNAQRGHPVCTVNLTGLLRLLIEALRGSWPTPAKPIPRGERAMRLARLAMIASSDPDSLQYAEPNAALHGNPDRYTTGRLLLSTATLSDHNHELATLVRSFEIYAEFIATRCPEVVKAFESKFKVSLRDWLVLIHVLVFNAREAARNRAPINPLITVDENDAGMARYAEVFRALSSTPTEFQAELAAGAPRGILALLRRTPLLRLAENRFVILHPGFLLGTADDGTWRQLSDILYGTPSYGRLQDAGGWAFEEYIKRVFRRTADAGPGRTFAAVPVAKASSHKRCDFALRVGDDLVLIDAKRIGLSVAMMEGGPTLDEKIDKEFGKACKQFLQTIADARTDGWNAVIPDLGVSSGWSPKRIIAWVATQRPLYFWYGSPKQLLSRIGIETEWRQSVSGRPRVLSAAELELLEIALQGEKLGQFVDAIATDAPSSVGGFDTYLRLTSYHGDALSPYFPKRRDEILKGF